MTVLLVDCGNTRIKWGFHHDGEWLSMGALARSDAVQLAAQWASHPAPRRALGCHVADAASRASVEEALRGRGIVCEWARSQTDQFGLVNGYDDPAQLGVDRWVAMLGARRRMQGKEKAFIVMSAGTAVTIDAVTAQGRFIGGVILPGATIMAEALERGTAALKRSPGHFQLPPTNTADAIATGALIAVGGALRRMEEMLSSLGEADCDVFITGGGAAELQPTLDRPAILIPNLVLEGLVEIAARTGVA